MTNSYNISIKFILALLFLFDLFNLAPAEAFSIVPAATTGKSFVPSHSYILENGSNGVITRQPIGFTSIKRGGTDDFLARLKAEYPQSRGWKFIAAGEDLKGSFTVSAYNVFFNMALGGGFAFDYLPLENDPVAANGTELHWIQRIVSNHQRGSMHGTPENRIAFQGQSKKSKAPQTPFFDVVPQKYMTKSIPPHFEYGAAKNDPENEHQWKAEVYLASISKKDPKTVTIYNGVRWGWENSVNLDPTQAPENPKVLP